jgi:hypothetical protein
MFIIVILLNNPNDNVIRDNHDSKLQLFNVYVTNSRVQ